MPRFFDDYSNTYLTHDSSAGRKQQRRGWKFRENFKLHYSANIDDWRKGPMGLASAQQAYIKAMGINDPMIPPLPDHWKQDQDDVTGILFYYNTETKERAWVRPGFFPPPPPGPMNRGPPPQRFNNQGGGGGGFQNRHNHHQGNNNNFNRGPPPPMHHQQQQQQRPPYGGGGGGPPPPMQGGPPPPFPGGPPPPPPGQYGGGPPPPNFQRPPPRY
mmetsp:Transcript_22704/g.56108  ORF Transcript_22704/g.56108 Transcript_22704/m.56108 type:complete len:215 (-) Transcript_22704:59-703(-)|eukprot:CAMPEP_0113629556 /NCGR_PEP_ID=MMETSP0017_2-20120614/15344_1 /TAXON_ID=2856 /ORGANISM="Cylindrotheca closterium" /LENGTH=214 /DNA_ID=CAMNT_0000539961 /DNA_START=196 /DNA_END=840 /DNA_ORIENTATION=+ /assembly_acc=CAM_ASM_000147